MENASKALIIAGGVLVSLIILSLLVTFFSNIRNLRQTEQTGDAIVQAAEFNKQYEAYNRTVYGSELVSIARKIEDYNKRDSELEDYTEIVLEVKFSQSAIDNLDAKGEFKNILSAKNYDSKSLEELMDNVEKEIKTRGNYKVKGKTIKELAGMRTNEIKELLELDKTESLPDEITEKIAAYNSAKTLLTSIKSNRFKCSGFEYDKNNGRVTKMSYEI